MQCPKCGYLGLDETRRCRNCSYDFSLAESFAQPGVSLEDLDRSIGQAGLHSPGVDVEGVLDHLDDARLVELASPDVPVAREVFDATSLDALLQHAEAEGILPEPAEAVMDLGLAGLTFDSEPAPAHEPALERLDIDWHDAPRADGGPDAAAASQSPVDTFVWPGAEVPSTLIAAEPSIDVDGLDLAPVETESPDGRADAPAVFVPIAAEAAPATAAPVPDRPPLDLSGLDVEDVPLVRLQRPRAPVAVRKTPMSPKLRAASRVTPQEPAFDFLDAGLAPEDASGGSETDPPVRGAGHLLTTSSLRRLAALAVDGVLFAAIDLAVLYLTLRMTGLSPAEWRILPLWPLAVFLGGMKLTYATVFTAFGGQTIGKMAAGIRVVALDDHPLTTGAAFRRALASAVAVLTAGLGYIPGLLGDRRALHDRAAGSRVIMCPVA